MNNMRMFGEPSDPDKTSFLHRYDRAALWKLLDKIAVKGGISRQKHAMIGHTPNDKSEIPYVSKYYLSDKPLFDFFNDVDHEPGKITIYPDRSLQTVIEIWNSQHSLSAYITIQDEIIDLDLEPCACATPQFSATMAFCIIRAISPEAIILCPPNRKFTRMLAIKKEAKAYKEIYQIDGHTLRDKTRLMERVAKRYAKKHPPGEW